MMKEEVNYPIAVKKRKELTIHGETRIDNYYWMRLSDEQKNSETLDAHTKEVIDYLEAENAYTKSKTAHLDGFKDQLFNEMVGRIKQNDESVPYLKNKYYYLTTYNEGKEYPIYTRKKLSLSADSEMLIDVNELASGFEYYSAKGLSVSPDNKILAYGEDTVSRRIYKIVFKNLTTGEYYNDEIENTTGGVVWANDNKTIFYTRKDETLRAFKIFKHTLGTSSEDDVEVYHEKDETFSTYVYKTKSGKYIVVGSYATVSSEFRYLNADTPNGDFVLFQKREREHEHSITHFDGSWYILTNMDGAKNFKIMRTDEGETDVKNWRPFIEHDENVFLSSIEIFKEYLVIDERRDGITKVRIVPWRNINESYNIDFGEETYMAHASVNKEYDTEIVRVFFSSMTTPSSTFDFNMKTKELVLMKQQEVVGDFKSSNYKSERLMVKSIGGVSIPVSLVYKKGYEKNGKQPLLLYAYGSYGHSIDPYFSSVRLSLLDRGFAYAIAHIRGGQEMGRHWYEDGKLFNKINTFTDFIDVGRYLVQNKFTSENNLYAMGGSAGGLLIGAVMNMAPNLWKGLIAAVPFVDVVTTMLDETIPLTTGEFDEWGNPKDEAFYKYIMKYSPYDNIEEKDYPALLITTGYHDSQVQYWEPAKWIAKLRDMKTDDNLLLLHTDMRAGHGGKSGRFESLRETALEYAFLLDLAGKVDD